MKDSELQNDTVRERNTHKDNIIAHVLVLQSPETFLAKHLT
jgi:hypothetical protein